jgi:selenocysteine-specific elongation factor
MIIGTAGHIDHGKSTLVTALTGRAMDRLAEERRRSITIDLNFAPLDLGKGRIAGMVDVPGHEDFVRTMVAGATGIDLALLIVAVDEGVMPQTEEHLSILEQLRVKAGIPVITKADLVDSDWLELVTSDLSERLAGSALRFEAPLAVSARTGAGMDLLRERLFAIASTLAPRAAGDAFRMPIDRVFSMAGVGTVVTGTAWSGRLTVGDPVRLLPSGVRSRVRSIESYGLPVERSEPGARTAVGLSGVDRSSLARGEVLVTDELPWLTTSAVDVEVTLEAAAPRPLLSRTRVRFLTGTVEIMARVLPQTPIEPGQTGLARLSLDRPLVARAEDRFVLRSYSPVGTIGGGRVLDPLPPARRSLWPAGLAASEPAQRFRSILARRPNGIPATLLPIMLGLPRSATAAVVRAEPDARSVGELVVARATVSQVSTDALARLKAYHRQHPSLPGMPLETLRHSLRATALVAEAALDDLARTGRISRHEGLVTLAGFAPRITGGDAEIERVVGILLDAHLSPPSVAELQHSTGHRDLLPLLRLAAATGRVEAVERDRYYAREALEQFTGVLHELGQEGSIVPGKIRDRLGISRKFLIPLLEWADAHGITIRVGEGREIRKGAGS